MASALDKLLNDLREECKIKKPVIKTKAAMTPSQIKEKYRNSTLVEDFNKVYEIIKKGGKS